jgi:hypothetical protein
MPAAINFMPDSSPYRLADGLGTGPKEGGGILLESIMVYHSHPVFELTNESRNNHEFIHRVIGVE